MNKEQIIKEIKRLNETEIIKVSGTDKERTIFKSDAFDIFEDEQQGLNPFDDYTYLWLSSFLDRVEETLKYNDVENLDQLHDLIQDNINEWADSETDVYTSELTKWLNDSNFNVHYINLAVNEFGKTDNILGVAQYLRIEECFNYYLECLINHLEVIDSEMLSGEDFEQVV